MNINNETYILDISLITPFTQDIRDSKNFFDQHNNFNQTNKKENSTCLQCADEVIDAGFDKRYGVKLSRFSKLALITADAIFQNKKIDFKNVDLNKMGIFLGNNFAGWDYVENQIYDLHTKSMNAINPYVATAWFPAAAQGEISINSKIYGHSKTFACDSLSAVLAIEYACDLLNQNKLDYALAGGAESLISPTLISALNGMNITSNQHKPSEAACLLLLTQQKEQQSKALAKIILIKKGRRLKKLLGDTINQLKLSAIDFFILPAYDKNNKKQSQLIEKEKNIVREFLKNKNNVDTPSNVFGETSGCNSALQIASAVKFLNHEIKTIVVVSRDYAKNQYVCSFLEK